ncbi:MAG TPA: SpvB/TcaC N-terminal domain-containing protein, partial [Pyrinomonadaceae bacterium]|nr:SpvB/TcaC N-terminal domain-containing protein [Pyrinomonadaceae bacterium]
MSNKSGVADQVISLPSGGGAIQGIGESFSPNLFTGTGNFSIPIAVPAGRSKLQPELSLTYSTGSGNGPYGLGWSLSGAGVSRRTSRGIPTYDDNIRSSRQPDVFSFSGSEDLVPIANVAGRTEYRPRTEGAFARIIHHHDLTEDYWEVLDKDGMISFYGTPQQLATDPAVVADPADRSKIFNWNMSEVRDPYGNRALYEYVRDSGEDGPHHWDQLYCERIRYADYSDEARDAQFLVDVTFHYEDRPDPFSVYSSGFEIRTRKRCVRIETHTHADVSRLVRVYHLIYLDQRPGFENLLPLSGVSLLSLIRVTGHDEDQTEELAPLEYSYSTFNPKGRRFFPLEGRDLPPRSLAHPDFDLADLFGRGLPDVLQMNGVVRYWRNRGNGEFDLPREMASALAGLKLADSGVQMIDADGDGRIDLMVTTPTLAGFFPLAANGEWDRRSFRRYRVAPSFSLEDPSVRLVDLDGDGVTDAIRSGSRLEYFFNDPEIGWNEVRTATRKSPDEFPNVDFADNRVRFADMTGDGSQDVVLVFDGNVEYWPNLGHGIWGKRVHMQNSPRFPIGYNPRRILLGDIDGDGLADIIYVDNTHIFLYVNQSGNRWSDPVLIEGTPPVTDMDAVRLVDMLGSGVAGILWSADRKEVSRDSLYFLDLTGDVKPYLLDEMNNHRGAITRVKYEPSTRFFLEDQQRPETRWKTSLPFPVLVVSRVEIIDEISGSKHTVEYSYHHGYFDGVEREFRGFGRVEQRDTQTFDDYHQSSPVGGSGFVEVAPQYFSPVVLTKTWFHQGPIGDAFGYVEPDFDNEYWPDDPSKLIRPPEVSDLLLRLTRSARRAAIRTLRGTILRTELYALDGSSREQNPYTVT